MLKNVKTSKGIIRVRKPKAKYIRKDILDKALGNKIGIKHENDFFKYVDKNSKSYKHTLSYPQYEWMRIVEEGEQYNAGGASLLR